MNIKNPYKFIEKANDTFNLFLSKFDEIENFMSVSSEDQKKISDSFDSFYDDYNDYQKNMNQKFLDLFDTLIEEISSNKKQINILESQIDELNNELNVKLENLEKNSNENFNSLNKNISKNFIDIHNSIKYNHDFIDIESDKLMAEINAFSDSVSKGFEDSRNLFNTNSQNQNDEIQKIYAEQIKSNETILLNYNEIKYLSELQNTNNEKLNNAIDLFVSNYNECKRCFFNDEEFLLKEYLDTDELFRMCYFNNIQFLSYSPFEHRILLKTKEGIILGTNNRLYTLKEVIGFDGYSVPQLYQFDDFVVFDIGMNRAYASLRFAEFDNCSAVYGFEIDDYTYDRAIDNINLNPNLAKKITPYNFGLSNKDDEVTLYYIQGKDGVNTVESDFTNVQYELKANKDKVKTKIVEVKKTTEVIENIIENENIKSKIVLKIDTEGSEYNIIDDLIESGLINKMDLIIGEGHKFLDRNVTDDLLKLGYKKIEFKENRINYNFAFIKEEFYNVWPLSV